MPGYKPRARPAVVTIPSYEEQVRGWMSYIAGARTLADQVTGYARLLRQLRNYCSWIVLPFDEVAAVFYQDLRKQKLRISTMDLKVAAVVLAHRATLLSRNLADFRRVPGLIVEDWSR